MDNGKGYMKMIQKGLRTGMIVHRYLMLAVLILPAVIARGQDSTSLLEKTLSPDGFIAIVRQFHPVVKQAGILVEKAKAELTLARGGFDPAVYLNTDQKTFDGKNYYNYFNPELKIPTWYGIEVKAGLEDNGGQLLSPEASPNQSSYVGISVPLAKNLLMDKRRAVLKQAKIFRSQSEAERQLLINDLLFEAYDAYWTWVRAWQVYQVLENAVKVNRERFELVKTGYRLGDRPAIDTVEALAQLQNFQFMWSESQVNLNNAAVEMSNFLWLGNNTYYQLSNDVLPSTVWEQNRIGVQPLPVLEELIAEARRTHPKLRIFQYKLQILEVERRLKFQSLLPTVDVRANLLNKGYNVLDGIGKPGFYENNNKFGLTIGLPLRLSEGRGGYKLARLKIQETNFAQLQEQQTVENKVRMYFNELAGLQQQVGIYESAYANYLTLFRGEDIRFRAGESSLFLLNTRENKVLETRQKLVELKTKYYKTQQALQWAAGLLR